MPRAPQEDFPLFPLSMVALPGEAIPLHIFEERYKLMIGECLERETEFGIVWMAEDGLREIGCACLVERVLERSEDGRINLVARGTRPFRLLRRQDHLPYPAGAVEFLDDDPEAGDDEATSTARSAYAELVRHAAGREPDPGELASMDAYAMAGTVDFGPEAKQGLLDLRSERARLALVTRLFRAALKRLELVAGAQERARCNGKIRFN